MQTSLSSPSVGGMKEHCDHRVDCLKMIQLIVDGEATEQQLDRLRLNLETCRPCIEMYHLEQEIKQLLHGRMEKKCCPENLVATIKSRIEQYS